MWLFDIFSRRLNHMGFVGDGDDVDVVTNTEAEFCIKITDAEAVSAETVYDLFRLVWNKLPNNEKEIEFGPLLVWDRLCRLLREINGFKGLIDLETTFFATHAKARQNHG
jgi:hypothetical protein